MERFSNTDLADLRIELMQSGLDSWQAGELISSFLSGRGYGISSRNAREAATRIESVGCSFESMHRELERVALVM